MKTEFDIDQEVWVLANNKPQKTTIEKIIIHNSSYVEYHLNYFTSKREQEMGATKEDLKNKIFK